MENSRQGIEYEQEDLLKLLNVETLTIALSDKNKSSSFCKIGFDGSVGKKSFLNVVFEYSNGEESIKDKFCITLDTDATFVEVPLRGLKIGYIKIGGDYSRIKFINLSKSIGLDSSSGGGGVIDTPYTLTYTSKTTGITYTVSLGDDGAYLGSNNAGIHIIGDSVAIHGLMAVPDEILLYDGLRGGVFAKYGDKLFGYYIEKSGEIPFKVTTTAGKVIPVTYGNSEPPSFADLGLSLAMNTKLSNTVLITNTDTD